MGRRVAITGAAGQLGRQLVIAFREVGDEVLALSRPAFDITRADDLGRLTSWAPEVVVNSAAWTDVDGCAREPERAMLVNATAAGAVAEAASRAGAAIVQISSNEVFDGSLDRPYTEADMPKPINPYGTSKLAGEKAVAAANGRYLIIRSSWLFGPEGTNFVTKILAAADRSRAEEKPLRVVEDEWGNPTWTPDLADSVRRQVDAARSGILHLAGVPPVSRLGWAQVALRAAGMTIEPTPIAAREYVRVSTPPRRAILAISEVANEPQLDWRTATEKYVRSLRVGNAAS